jgi:hypothetical protein
LIDWEDWQYIDKERSLKGLLIGYNMIEKELHDGYKEFDEDRLQK